MRSLILTLMQPPTNRIHCAPFGSLMRWGPSWGHDKRVFCNPPYGRMLEPFVRRCAHESVWNTIVALIPVRTRAAWWHECVIRKAAEIRFIRKRVKFLRPDGVQAAFTLACDSALIVWRPGVNGARVISWEQAA